MKKEAAPFPIRTKPHLHQPPPPQKKIAFRSLFNIHSLMPKRTPEKQKPPKLKRQSGQNSKIGRRRGSEILNGAKCAGRATSSLCGRMIFQNLSGNSPTDSYRTRFVESQRLDCQQQSSAVSLRTIFQSNYFHGLGHRSSILIHFSFL